MTQAIGIEPMVQAVPLENDQPLYEVVNGQRVEKPPMGVYESVIAFDLAFYLRSFLENHPLGRVLIETLFDLSIIGRQRRPDVAFVSSNRWPRNRPIPRGEAAWAVIPELAIEVVSPTNIADQVLLKVHEYFRSGVLQVWVIWPELEEVYVYEDTKRIRVLGRNEKLEGGTLLPDFQLPLAVLFPGPATEGAQST